MASQLIRVVVTTILVVGLAACSNNSSGKRVSFSTRALTLVERDQVDRARVTQGNPPPEEFTAVLSQQGHQLQVGIVSGVCSGQGLNVKEARIRDSSRLVLKLEALPKVNEGPVRCGGVAVDLGVVVRLPSSATFAGAVEVMHQ